MNIAADFSYAELSDKFMQRVAVITLMLAVVLGISATQSIVGDDLAWYLSQIERVLAIVMVVTALLGLLPLMVKKLSLNRKLRKSQLEGFINDVAHKSFTFAWAATFVSVSLSKLFLQQQLAELPLESLLEFIQAILFGAYAVCFLILNKSESDHEDFEQTVGD